MSRSDDQSPRSKPQRTAAEGEDETLDEQLPNDPPAAPAERLADRDLLPPRRAAGEEHVREIEAGDEKHDRATCRGEAARRAQDRLRPAGSCWWKNARAARS